MTRLMRFTRFTRVVMVALCLHGPCGITPTRAQTGEPNITSAQLTPVIPESAPTSKTRGRFQQTVITVTIGEGSVSLASTSDGRGRLRTDDLAELVVQQPDGITRTWRHDFRDRATGQIQAIAPADVTNLFGAGTHVVTLTLTDALPPVFSSSAYYLAFAKLGAVTPTPLPTVAVAATALPASRLIMATATTAPTAPTAPTVVKVAAVAIAPVRESTSRPSATPTAPQTNAAVVPQPGRDEWRVGAMAVPIAGTLAALLAVIVVAMVLATLRRRTPASRLTGIVHLYDAASREQCANVDLTQFGDAAVIRVDPLIIERLSAHDKSGEALAIIRTTQAGTCEVIVGEQHVALHDLNDVLLGNRVRLEYRAPAFEAQPALAQVATE